MLSEKEREKERQRERGNGRAGRKNYVREYLQRPLKSVREKREKSFKYLPQTMPFFVQIMLQSMQGNY